MTAPLDAAGVAAELGISRALFLRTRGELERRGFPKPLPLASRPLSPGEISRGKIRKGRTPLVWCAEAVAAWKLDPRPAAAREPANDRAPRGAARDQELLRRRMG